MGVMLSAGGSFRWLRDSLGEPETATARLTGEDPYDLLTREAARAPAGSEGLLFLPYLTGERTPISRSTGTRRICRTDRAARQSAT